MEFLFVNYVLFVVDDNSLVIYVENYVMVDNVFKGIVSIVEEVIVEKNVCIIFGGVDNFVSDVMIYVNCCGYIGIDS